MEFRLLHTEVPRLRLDKIEPEEEKEAVEPGMEAGYKLALNVFLDSNRKEIFGVLFDIELIHHGEFKLKLNYLAWFESPQPVSKEDVRSPFARINAPAIAFPYLRSFISLLTLNSGFRPAILPTVNFVKMFEEFKAREQKSKAAPSEKG
ncbi:MAG: protein-export chaperone SecB [Saprospiraceae bacterium]